jgi:hypothetical protein
LWERSTQFGEAAEGETTSIEDDSPQIFTEQHRSAENPIGGLIGVSLRKSVAERLVGQFDSLRLREMRRPLTKLGEVVKLNHDSRQLF